MFCDNTRRKNGAFCPSPAAVSCFSTSMNYPSPQLSLYLSAFYPPLLVLLSVRFISSICAISLSRPSAACRCDVMGLSVAGPTGRLPWHCFPPFHHSNFLPLDQIDDGDSLPHPIENKYTDSVAKNAVTPAMSCLI